MRPLRSLAALAALGLTLALASPGGAAVQGVGAAGAASRATT